MIRTIKEIHSSTLFLRGEKILNVFLRMRVCVKWNLCACACEVGAREPKSVTSTAAEVRCNQE